MQVALEQPESLKWSDRIDSHLQLVLEPLRRLQRAPGPEHQLVVASLRSQTDQEHLRMVLLLTHQKGQEH